MTAKTYPENKADEKPTGFVFNGRKVLIDEIIDYWYDEHHEYLRLLADDERIYFLRREVGNYWEVERIYGY